MVAGRVRGDLRQVGDAQHPTTVAEFGEQTAYDLGNAPADADIDLVEAAYWQPGL